MIRLKDVEKTYENGTEALQGISFTIEDGEFVFLVGPSGSGKSTIIKLLTGEVIPTAGRVMVNGFSMSRISDRQIPYMAPHHRRDLSGLPPDPQKDGVRQPEPCHAGGGGHAP